MAISAILAALAAAGSAIGSGATAAAGAVGSAAGAAGSAIGSAAGAVGSALGEAAGTVGSALGEAAQGIGSGVQGLFGSGGEAVGQTGQMLADAGGMTLSDVPELGSLASYMPSSSGPGVGAAPVSGGGPAPGGIVGGYIGEPVNPAMVSGGGPTVVPSYSSAPSVDMGGGFLGGKPSPSFLDTAMPYLKKYGPLAMKMMGGGGGGGAQAQVAPPAPIGSLSQSPFRAGPYSSAGRRGDMADLYDWRRYL